MKELPVEFVSRMKELLKEEYPLYEKSLCDAPVKGFRVNTDKIYIEEYGKLDKLSNGKIPYVGNGYYLGYEKVGNHPYHHAGMIYVQEPAAMAPAECIDIDPDWKILDMCAAPGGKSTQLKNKLGENGILVSNEIIPSRCRILAGNIERLGLLNTVTTCMDTKRLSETFPNTFDMIMVDAPCSGEGMFRKDDTAIAEWSTGNVKRCAERQREILDNAVKLVKSGGYIVYATCTFSLEENEMTVDSFLQRYPDFEILPVTQRVRENSCEGIAFEGCYSDKLHRAVRFYPHKNRGEGQFCAVLHHIGTKEAEAFGPQKAPEKPDKAVIEFLDSVLEDYKKDNVIMYNGNAVYFTPDFPINKGTAFSCGVTIGEVKKNYIMPHHQFFMALGNKFRKKIELSLDDPRVAKYLHGEEIDADCENGWAAVTVDGCTLGGAKVVNGRAKNHYPKGLRTL